MLKKFSLPAVFSATTRAAALFAVVAGLAAAPMPGQAQNFIAVSPNYTTRPLPPDTSTGVVPQTSGLYNFKYRQCRSSSDCVSYDAGCHAPVAINRGALPAFNAYHLGMSRAQDCSFVNNGTNGVPDCIGGVCSLIPARTVLDQPDSPDFCTTDQECTVAADSCGKKTAVNTRHAGLNAVRASQACAAPQDDRKVSQLVCQHNKCTVILDNYSTGQ